MRYAQIKKGNKLHLVYEPGEKNVPIGHLSAPLCNPKYKGSYRMNINVPLRNACKNCLRILQANQSRRKQ